jgi:hypothetical protein
VAISSDQRDAAVASVLGWCALCLVIGWAGIGVLDGSVRAVDAWRTHDALRPGGAGWVDPVLPLGGDILLFMLWMGGLGALALGTAVGVAALVLRAEKVRAAMLLVVVAAGGVAQYLFVVLTASAGWSFVETDRVEGNLAAAAGAVVAPVVVLLATWQALRPVLRAPRSTREPAAAG